MLMGLIWTAMIVVSVLFGCLNGTVGQVQQAALEGAQAAIELCIVIGGAVCLWCAVMELMRASGLAEALSHALRPILRRLFPEVRGTRLSCSRFRQMSAQICSVSAMRQRRWGFARHRRWHDLHRRARRQMNCADSSF